MKPGGWDAKCFTLTLEVMTYFQFIIYHIVADVYTICVYFNGTCTNISPFSGLFTSTELRIIIIVEDLSLETIILDDCTLKDLNQIFVSISSWELLELRIFFLLCPCLAHCFI